MLWLWITPTAERVPAKMTDHDRPRACKILATLGPASRSTRNIIEMIEHGADAFRVNMSHGDHDTHAETIARVRKAAQETRRHIGVLCDLQGPKLRLGDLPEDGVAVKAMERRWLALGEDWDGEALPAPHPELFAALEEGASLQFDDGNVTARVVSLEKERAELEFLNPGELSSHKGINLPGRRLPISALTEKDLEDLDFALAHKADLIAVSFVQRPEDVREAKERVGGRAKLISKIEKPSAVETLEEIVELSDGIMVARGDLGVELPLEDVPVVQRRIIRLCRRAGKPVIVATQMLQSMVTAATPTRAEASDIATAVYLGTDAVMLSAETAVGRHPTTAVAIMDRIIGAVEEDPEYHRYLPVLEDPDRSSEPRALSYAVRAACEARACDAILAFTQSGASAIAVARERPRARIIAVSPNEDSANRMALVWGVEAMTRPEVDTFDEAIEQARALMAELDGIEHAVLIGGLPFGSEGRTNVMHILA